MITSWDNCTRVTLLIGSGTRTVVSIVYNQQTSVCILFEPIYIRPQFLRMHFSVLFPGSGGVPAVSSRRVPGRGAVLAAAVFQVSHEGSGGPGPGHRLRQLPHQHLRSERAGMACGRSCGMPDRECSSNN